MSPDFAHAAHQESVKAIIKGLVAHEASRPGFFIHTSGTGVLLGDDLKANTFGIARDHIFNDLSDVAEVTSLPENPLRAVDDLVLTAGTKHCDLVKTAIVCPPTIYGKGRGPCNNRSHQVPALCKATLDRGHGIKVNEGQNIWGNVHIQDLSKLYLSLVETAALNVAGFVGKPAIWGPSGYFFCENGEHVWGDVAHWIASEACQLGLIQKASVKSITPDEANKITFWGSGLWGANSRARAKRARAVFDWQPTAPSLRSEIRASLVAEADQMNIHVCRCKRSAGSESDGPRKAARIGQDLLNSHRTAIEV